MARRVPTGNVLSLCLERRWLILSRVRVALGLVGVAAGTAWAVGGAHALVTAGAAALKVVPALAIAAGVLLVVRAVVPHNAIAGPLVLIIGGSLALAAQLGWLTVGVWDGIAPTLLVAGGVVIAMSRRSRPDPAAAVVTRHWSVFLPNKHAIRETTPHKLIVRCVLGDFFLDLSNAGCPGSVGEVTVDVTVLASWVELRVPHDWEVLAGRVDLTARVRFVGDVDSESTDVGDEPDDSGESEDDEAGRQRVVLNVQGWASRVIVSRTHSPDSSLPAAEPPASP